MKTLTVAIVLVASSVAHAFDNCYVLNGFPADQARCYQQANDNNQRQQQLNQDALESRRENANAMNTAILLDQLQAARQGQPINPNTLPAVLAPSQVPQN